MKEHLLHKKANIGPCMDVRGYAGRIYAIQRDHGGRLAVLSEALELLCAYDGIGNARQIEIKDGVAAISARENGLWLFDVRNEIPVLLSHYRTVEFATGITMYKNFVLVSCRQYGVEIVDIRDPREPRYIGVIRIGEAQSACVYRDVLYGGVWGEMKVIAVDISDIRHPKRLADFPLTGRGDGVVVRDGILYASTGQHRRGIENLTDESDPCFGMGNGIERYDVRDPAHPKHLSWDFFAEGYSISFDMWKPMLAGDTLICSDSILGIYGYDAYTMEQRFHILPPAVNGAPDPVTGTAICGGRLYVTTGLGGLYRFDELMLEEPYRYDEAPSGGEFSPSFSCESEGACTLSQVYHGAFPVLAAAELSNGYFALACGNGGVQIIERGSMECVSLWNADGFCYDVAVSGNVIAAAYGECGVRMLRYDGEVLTLLSEMMFEASVQQLGFSENGKFLILTCGGAALKSLDVSDAEHPRLVYDFRSNKGLLYGENLLAHSVGDGVSLFWHRVGLVTTDPEHGDRAFHEILWKTRKGFMGYCPGNGCDFDGEHILFVRKEGYVLLPTDGSGSVDDLPIYRAEYPIRGKLCVCGTYLVATERAEGTVTVTDISDIHHPVSIGRIVTSASPSRAFVSSTGEVFLAGRYAGLLLLTLDTGNSDKK